MQGDFWSAYNKASQYIKDFFYKEELNELIDSIEKKYQLPPNILGGIVGDFVLRLVDERNLSLELKNQFDIEMAQASKIKEELVTKLFRLDPQIKQYILEEDKDMETIIQSQEKQDESSPVDYEKTLAMVLPQIKSLIQANDIGRLQTIVSSYYGNVRTLQQTKEKLMHSQKIGGLELDEQTSELIVNILKNTDPVRKQVEAVDESSMQDTIQEKTKQIMNIAQGDKKKLENMLQLYMEQKDAVSLIAVLRVMTATQLLLEGVLEMPIYQQFVAQHLNQDQQGHFQQNRNHPRYIQLFLKTLLIDHVGLQQQIAAKYMSQISNMLGKLGQNEYADMAYFDVESQSFKFTKYQ